MTLKDKISSLVVQFDQKQFGKPHHNRYALGIYLQQLDNIILDIELGAETRAALVAGYNGRLVDYVLNGLGFPVTTREEKIGSGIYQPISKNHPEY